MPQIRIMLDLDLDNDAFTEDAPLRVGQILNAMSTTIAALPSLTHGASSAVLDPNGNSVGGWRIAHDLDELRGDVCMALDDMGYLSVANEVAGWSMSDIGDYAAEDGRPEKIAARIIIDNGLAPDDQEY